MRQASWEEMFRQGTGEDAKRPSSWSRFNWVSWEELVTLAIVMVAFLTVVRSIDNADWVAEMPSLYTIGFIGLGGGLVLAHWRGLPALIAHLMALVIGVVSVLVVVASTLEGTLFTRIDEVIDRFRLWAEAVFTGGISNDNLPFVVLVVSATYVAAYIAAWSIFRWYNAWLALVPAGLALLTNISYLPGQKSLPLLIYLFCAILLLARVNLLRRARDWRANNTRYPDFISLHVLNVTVWVGLALLAAAWVLPVGNGSGFLYSMWATITSPVAEPLRDLGRVFTAIDSKRGSSVHQFGSTMPLQGEISLGSSEVMQVTASEIGFLRAQSYDLYTAQGWKVGTQSNITSGVWPALQALQSVDEATRQRRRPVSLQVTTSKRSNVVISAGQPLSVNIDTRVVLGPGPSDVTSIRPARRLDGESQYRVDSSVSNASANNLRNASTAYPPGIEPYLQLPDGLPDRIRQKAREVTSGAATVYDRATEIERYLRSFPVDLKIDAAPPKADSIDYFLFDAQRGYFDYHASAMVVMLRTLGIPARLAVGYVLHAEDRVPQTNVYVVSEGDAFAWPEVYFPALGWVEFNPTPNEPPVFRSGIDSDFFPGFDPLDPFFDDAFLMPEDFGEVDPAAGALDQFVVKEESNTFSRIVTLVILGLIGLTAVGLVTFQYSLHRGLAGYSFPIQVWEKTLRLGGWAHLRTLPQETPREVMTRLKRELPEVEDLDFMSESYIRARYGGKELTEPEKERLEAVWSKTRNNLLGRLLRWK